MSQIIRCDPVCYTDDGKMDAEMENRPHGDWVEYRDYEAVCSKYDAELDRLASENAALREALLRTTSWLDEVTDPDSTVIDPLQIAAVKAGRDALGRYPGRRHDPRLWDGQWDVTHTGEMDVPPMNAEQQAAFWARYGALPSLLAGKKVIVVEVPGSDSRALDAQKEEA